ncbi:MAG: alpha/beta hydrolase family esterase [Bosea sp. (in: a-proteobacteria)]
MLTMPLLGPLLLALLACLAGSLPALAQTQGSITTADGQRSYLADLPAAGPPAALVFVLHGATGTSSQVREYSAWGKIAARENIAVIYPQGLDKRWNDARPPASRKNRPNMDLADDVGLIRALAAKFIKQGVADPRRIYVTGISNGGHLAYRLACEASDLVSAAAPVIANLSAALLNHCGGKPVPMLIMNGTDDKLSLWAGEAATAGPASAILSAPDSLAFFARRNGCSPQFSERRLPQRVANSESSVTVISGNGCRARTELYRVDGGGHQMPSFGPARPYPMLHRMLGTRNQDIEGAEVIWRFFAATR